MLLPTVFDRQVATHQAQENLSPRASRAKLTVSLSANGAMAQTRTCKTWQQVSKLAKGTKATPGERSPRTHEVLIATIEAPNAPLEPLVHEQINNMRKAQETLRVV